MMGSNKRNTFFVKEIVFNSKGQISLKEVFLLRNFNTFSRVLKPKKIIKLNRYSFFSKKC